MQPLSVRNLAFAAVLIALTACGTSMMNGGSAANNSSTGTIGVDESGAQYLDPGANAVVALNGNAANGNVVVGGTDPNRAACEALKHTLRADDANLRDSNDFVAAEQSTQFQAVLTAAKAAKAAGCSANILTASTTCQADITTLDTDVEAFWQSAVFKTLENSAPFTAVEQDITALQTAGCLDAKTTGSSCPGHGGKDGNGGGGTATNPNTTSDPNATSKDHSGRF